MLGEPTKLILHSRRNCAIKLPKSRTQSRICGKGKTCGECHALADFNNALPDSFWVAIRSMSISSRSAASSERESDSCLEMRPEQMLFYTLTAPAQREDSENNEKDALVEGGYGNRKKLPVRRSLGRPTVGSANTVDCCHAWL